MLIQKLCGALFYGGRAAQLAQFIQLKLWFLMTGNVGRAAPGKDDGQAAKAKMTGGQPRKDHGQAAGQRRRVGSPRQRRRAGSERFDARGGKGGTREGKVGKALSLCGSFTLVLWSRTLFSFTMSMRTRRKSKAGRCSRCRCRRARC
jgi:hypothetical protein